MAIKDILINHAIETINSIEDIYIEDISGNSNFRKSLFDMINAVSPQNYTLLTTDFINPTKAPIGSVRNTKMVLLEIVDINALNARYVWYNRIHTSKFGTLTLPKNNAVNVSDLIDSINAKLGSSILQSELEDFALPDARSDGSVSFQLLFNDTSFRYYSGVEFAIKSVILSEPNTKQSIGLANVDNTSDLQKPLSTAQLQSNIDARTSIEVYVRQYVLEQNQLITKQSLGLSNVDNTSDLQKPLSNAQIQSSIDARASMEDYVNQRTSTSSGNTTYQAPVWNIVEW